MKTLTLLSLMLIISCKSTTEESALNSGDTVNQKLYVNENSDFNAQPEDSNSFSAQITKNRNSEILDSDSINFNTLKRINVGHLFQTDNYSMDGAIGDTFKRLRIHISKAEKSNEDSIIYEVVGKSKVNSNICNFAGQIKITSVTKYNDTESNDDGPPYDVMGDISGTFEFLEDKEQRGTGIFRGSFTINWNLNENSEIVIGSAWYTYRSNMVNFTGQWTEYKTKVSKTICWGSDIPSCLPHDFNCSDGPDFIPCDKYASNGWETLRASFDYQDETLRKKAMNAEIGRWWD